MLQKSDNLAATVAHGQKRRGPSFSGKIKLGR
jgi:hypothetical protein